MVVMQSRPLVAGAAQGSAFVLTEPLSLWGGLNAETGEITDRHHPASGATVTAQVLVMPAGRGSSSASSVLLEAIRLGTAPAAIITREVDGILALGAVVACEVYGVAMPVLVVSADDYAQLRTGQRISVQEDGAIHVDG
jgi:uncharacterized protein